MIVHPIGRRYGLEITNGETKILFTFQQLDFKTKSLISNQTITQIHGSIQMDSTMQCFLNIKHGLKHVKGLLNSDESKYRLKFECNKKLALTDACVDEILATPLHNDLIYSARCMMDGIPTEVINPITEKPLEGVKILSPSELGGLPKNG